MSVLMIYSIIFFMLQPMMFVLTYIFKNNIIKIDENYYMNCDAIAYCEFTKNIIYINGYALWLICWFCIIGLVFHFYTCCCCEKNCPMCIKIIDKFSSILIIIMLGIYLVVFVDVLMQIFMNFSINFIFPFPVAFYDRTEVLFFSGYMLTIFNFIISCIRKYSNDNICCDD